MGTVVASLVVRVLSDVGDAVGGLNKVDRAVSRTAAHMKSIGAGMTKAGGQMARAVTVPLVALGVATVKFASDQAEAMSAVKTVFGSSAKDVAGFSGSVAKDLGLSRGEALQTATTFGAMGQKIGLTGKDLVAFSNSSLKAGADLASFYNAPVPEALAAIQSGLQGEAEPLRRFGIFLSDANLNQYALAKGVGKTTQEMTEQEKIALRQAFILDNMGAASGDFARTSGGLANQLRIVTAQLKDAAATMGTILLPYALKVVGVISSLADKFAQLSPHTQAVIVVIAGVAAVVGPVLLVLGSLASAVGAIIAIAPAMGAAAAVAFGPWGIAIMAVVGIIAALAVAYKTNFLGFGDAVRFVAGVVGGALDSVIGFFRTLVSYFEIARKQGVDPVSAAFYALANTLERMHGPFDSISRALFAIARFSEKAYRAARLFFEALRKLGGNDSARVHKILNALPTPLAKLVILFGRIKTAVHVFIDAWRTAGALAAFQTIPRSLELIGRTLGNLMQSLGLNRFGDAIRGVFKALGDVIGDVVSLVDDLIHGRWGQVWDDFKRLVEDAVRLAIATFMANLGLWRDALDGLIALFDAIDWGAVGTFLWNGFKAALAFVFATVVPYLIGLFGKIPWGKIVATLGNLANLLLAKGRELLGGLYDGAVAFFTDTVVPWLAGLGAKALAAIPGLLKSLADKGGELLHGFLNGVEDFFKGDVTDWFHAIVDKIVALIPAAGAFFDALKFIGAELLSGLRKGLDVAWGAAKGVAAFFKDIVSAIVSAVPGPDAFFKAIGFVAAEILGGLRKALDKAWSIGGGVAAFFKDLASGVRSLLEGVKWDDIAGAIGKIIDPLTRLADAITAVTDAFGKAGGWIGKNLKKVGIGGDDGAGAAPAPTTPATGGTLTVARFDVGTTLTDIQGFAAAVVAAFTSLTPYLIFPSATGGAVGHVGKMTPHPFDGSNALADIQTFATDGAVAVLDLKTSITGSMVAIAVAASTYSVIARDVIVAQLQDAATLGAVAILDLNTSTTNSFRRMNEDAKLFVGSMRTVVVTQTQDAATRGALAILDLNRSTTASFIRINADAKLFIGSARTVIVTQLQNAGTNGAVAIFDLRVSVGDSFRRMRDVATSVAGSMNDRVTNQFVGMRNNAVAITNDLVAKVTAALDGIPSSKTITVDIIATTRAAVGGGGGGRVGGGGIGGAVGSLSSMVSAAASSAGVPVGLINAIMQVESGGVWQTSPAGAIGYMQVMPFWGPELGLDLYDPAQNILAGAMIIAQNIAAAGGSIYEGLRMYHGYGYDGFTTDTQYAQMIMDIYGGYRRGGRVTTPLALLGEDGPELYAGLQGGHVFTASQTRALMSGGGGRGDGDTWYVDVTVLGNGTEESGRAVARGLISEFNKRRVPGR